MPLPRPRAALAALPRPRAALAPLPRPLLAGLTVAIALAAPAAATAATGTHRSGRTSASTPAGATITGRVTEAPHRALAGMRVQAQPSAGCPATAATCGPATVSGRSGRYTLSGLAPGSYAMTVLDGTTTLRLATVTIADAASTVRVALTLPAPAVPPGTHPRSARRDLAWLNAERARDGQRAGVALNPRWSLECAAHDAYERANDVLDPSENPAATDASTGGAWAGLNSVLAEGRWTKAASPWEDAPVHLLALLAPSLSVVGIDDGSGLQCATTWPGLVRGPGHTDTVSTYPAAGQRGVPASELARESPFVPPQFAGLSAKRATGRELFVYLNRAGQTGQAPVQIVRASLRHAGHAVAVRWVDTTTATLGPYLAGGIVIPVHPLLRGASYRASVSVRDGGRTLTHTWSFRTR